ncbi:MAG TPA: galactokinase family protein [Acidimicrobiales bacterium]|nr:galactokinase family protein [Acidimicrobiales bacterium]
MPTARAPGRVTLIGDHTDYNGGLSLPMAINLATEVAYLPKPDSFLVGIDSDQYPGQPVEIAIDGGWTWGAAAAAAGVALPEHGQLAAALLRLQQPPAGGSMKVTSTLPVGAGLSSSAAFSVALLLALGHRDDPMALALTCQEAERLAGSHVGLLDPLAIAGAQAGHALHIDFHTLEMRQVPIPADAAFVIVHSGSPRLLVDSEYATRRAECERAAHVLGRPLGLCTLGDLSELSEPVLRRRARHVVTESARVREAERLLARGNLVALGALMTEGHRSLAVDYRVSVPAVDQLVDELLAMPGVLGARMSGGGFGGCVIALCLGDSPALDPMAHSPRRAWRISPAGGAQRQPEPAT